VAQAPSPVAQPSAVSPAPVAQLAGAAPTPETNAPDAHGAGPVPRTVAPEQRAHVSPPGTPLGGFSGVPHGSGTAPPSAQASQVGASPAAMSQVGAVAQRTSAQAPLGANGTGGYFQGQTSVEPLAQRPGGTDVGPYGIAPQLPGSTQAQLPGTAPMTAPITAQVPARTRSGAMSLFLVLLMASGVSAAVVGGVYFANEHAKAEDRHDDPPTLPIEPPPAVTVSSTPQPVATTPQPPPVFATARPPVTTTPPTSKPPPQKPAAPTGPLGLPTPPPLVLPSALPPLTLPSGFPPLIPLPSTAQRPESTSPGGGASPPPGGGASPPPGGGASPPPGGGASPPDTSPPPTSTTGRRRIPIPRGAKN
jgi:hypothetical protein